MAWTPTEKEYLKNTAGRIPLSELVRNLNKPENNIKKMASRMGLSLSFYGSGCHKVVHSVGDIEDAKALLATGKHTNREIGTITGLPENYVSKLKRKIREVKHLDLMQAVFC